MRIVLLVQRGNLQPSLDHGAFALLDGQRQPLDGVQRVAELRGANVEIFLLGKLTASEGLANHDHHAVELNLDPELDAMQESRLLDEEILVENGEVTGAIVLGVDLGDGLNEIGFAVGGEGVLGPLEIMGSGDALQIAGETLVTASGVPSADVLAESLQASAVGGHVLGLDPDGINAVTAGGGHGINAEIVMGERHVTTLHGSRQVHGVSEAGAEHGVHLGGDVLDALERLELGGERAEITKSGVRETGGGQDVREGDIQLVGHVLVISQDPAGQIADLGSRTCESFQLNENYYSMLLNCVPL